MNSGRAFSYSARMMTPAEIVGSVLGVIGVGLMIRQHLLAWPVGMIQVAIYTWVFYTARLYSDSLLQVAFFVLLGYGWWAWWRGERLGVKRSELPVRALTLQARIVYLVVGIGVALGWGTLMAKKTDAALPYWDAFILVFSLISQWLQARKRIENWLGWTAVNVVAVGVYFAKDLYLTAALYVVFLGLAVAGWFTWRKSLVVKNP